MADTTVVKYWIREQSFSDWELFGNTAIENLENENASETIVERWDSESNTFRPLTKEQTFYHNEDKDISDRIDFNWNKELQIWDTTQMISYLYGEEAFITRYEKRTWGESPTRVLEVLDSDYTIAHPELLLPTSAISAIPADAFQHKVNSKQSFRYGSSTNELQQFRETKFYYSNVERVLSASVDNTSNVSIALYPNPASAFIIVNFPHSYHEASFEVFDLNGKKLLYKTVTNREKINVSNLNHGLYIYSVSIDDRKTIGKLLIK